MMTSLWKPAAKAALAAVLIGLIGVFGQLAGQPWLFASLGPSAALQATMPQLPMSRAWNVAVGQIIAVGVGFAAIYATGAADVPAFSAGHALVFARVEAAALAIFLGIALEYVLRATHAPAASTTLLIALGITPPTWSSAAAMLCGILLVTVLGEAARQAQLRLSA